MAGHTKWSKVKRLKGTLDQKRGRLISKLAKEILVATRMGGGDPDGNPRLRSAILAARAQSLPGEAIDRAIRRGTGEGPEASALEELISEGDGSRGGALATDKRNRTAPDLRFFFSKKHGCLASSGAVAYFFQKKGSLTVPAAAIHEERMLELALEAGAEELASDHSHHVITTSADKLYAVAEALRSAGEVSDSQQLTFVPDALVTVHNESVATQVLRLIYAPADNDDVQNVLTNFDASEEVLTKISG